MSSQSALPHRPAVGGDLRASGVHAVDGRGGSGLRLRLARASKSALLDADVTGTLALYLFADAVLAELRSGLPSATRTMGASSRPPEGLRAAQGAHGMLRVARSGRCSFRGRALQCRCMTEAATWRVNSAGGMRGPRDR